jgi:FkbM family methyltransferase
VSVTRDRIVRQLAHAYGALPVRPGGRRLHGLLRRYMRHSADHGPVVIEVDGIWFELDMNEVIDANIYYRGAYEVRATRTVRSVVKPGMTVLDVGANFGYYTLNLAKLVGESGTVIAFEPTALAQRKLVANLARNPYRNVVVEKLALSDRSEARVVAVDETAFRASWTVEGGRAEREPETVPFERFDDYVDRTGLDRVDFVKVDIDGYELRFVRGAERTLREHRPPMFMEIGKPSMAAIGDDPLELARRLAELGYAFEGEDRKRRFSTPEELIDAIPDDGAAMVFLSPRN